MPTAKKLPIAKPSGRGVKDIPAARLAQLNAGAPATTLTECLAVDFAVLMRTAAPQAGPEAIARMQAQAAELQRIGTAISNIKLATAAIGFGRYLNGLVRLGGALPRTDLEKKAQCLLAFMPRDADEASYAA